MLRLVIFSSLLIEVLGGFPEYICDRMEEGTEVPIKYVPYMVSIHGPGGKDPDYICSGSIISKKHILTAGQCLSTQLYPWRITVRTGSPYTDRGGVVYRGRRIIVHSNFRLGSVTHDRDYDFAIVQLRETITFNENTLPVTLPNKYDEVVNDEMIHVTGWGSEKTTDHLHSQSVTRELDGMCYETYLNIDDHTFGGITPRMVCAKYKSTDICYGDVGAPLVANDIQHGILSWGRSCESYAPEVYAKVSSVRSWIKRRTSV